MPGAGDAVTIAAWRPYHARWPEVLAAAAALGQEGWVVATAPWHRSAHLLVAQEGGALAGFLRFVVQAIGPDLDRPPVMLGDRPLTAAKVLACGVLPACRGRGIGRALQEAAIARAARLGCHPRCAPTAAARTPPTTGSSWRWGSACTRSCGARTRPGPTSSCRAGGASAPDRRQAGGPPGVGAPACRGREQAVYRGS